MFFVGGRLTRTPAYQWHVSIGLYQQLAGAFFTMVTCSVWVMDGDSGESAADSPSILGFSVSRPVLVHWRAAFVLTPPGADRCIATQHRRSMPNRSAGGEGPCTVAHV